MKTECGTWWLYYGVLTVVNMRRHHRKNRPEMIPKTKEKAISLSTVKWLKEKGGLYYVSI